MSYLSIKNWAKFQHYKDRSPPWIKLHRELLDDYQFSCLQDASKAHLMLLWLLASQLDNKIPNDQKWLKNRLGLTVNIDLKELINNGFLVVYQDASKPLAECSPEREAETEAERIKKGRKKSEKICLEELSVSHIEKWLNEKRALGKYLTIDEHGHLEYFKDYCLGNNKTYSDYTAAFRNSFNWNNAIKKGARHGPRDKYTDTDALAEVLADIEREEQANSPPCSAMLRDPGHLRQITGTVENIDAGDDRGFEQIPPSHNQNGFHEMEAGGIENSNGSGDFKTH